MIKKKNGLVLVGYLSGDEMAIWIDKYRPKLFSELVGQDEVKKKLENMNLKECPHLLFVGGSGVGKTTVAFILARKWLGDNWQGSFMELNASDERGIGTVRDQIKMFCKSVPFGVDRKIIFLDECDAMTTDAQHALRRVMEKYTETTLFILSCNYFSKIIDAIKSRCSTNFFSPITDDKILYFLTYISKNENLKVEEGVLGKIVERSKGDMRKAINDLQSLSATGEIKLEDIKKLPSVDALFGSITKMNFILAKQEVERLVENGTPPRELVEECSKWLLNSSTVSDNIKESLFLLLSDIDYKLIMGCSENLQLTRFLLESIRVIRNGINNNPTK